MDDFAKALNQGYQVQENWSDTLRANKADLIKEVSKFKRMFAEASQRLEDLRDAYSNYRDVSEITKQSYKEGMLKSIDDFSQAVASLPDNLPSNFEVKIRPFSGALKIELDEVREWQSTTRKSAGIKIKELLTLEKPSAQRSPTTQPDDVLPPPLYRDMAFQTEVLYTLIIKAGAREMWLSQLVMRSEDGIPGPGDVDYPDAIRELAKKGKIEILEWKNQKYTDWWGAYTYNQNVRFRIKQAVQ